MTRIQSSWLSAFVMTVMMTVLVATSAYAQTFSVLYNFGSRSLDPANPTLYGTPVQGRDGNFYATSTFGGSHHGSGTVFRITPEGKLKVLYNFCSLPSCDDGLSPGGLNLGFDGSFYGTTSNGGSQALGTLFKITPQGVFTQLYSFTGSPSDGAVPDSAPIRGNDGNLYGSTNGSGINFGSIYKLNPSTGAVTFLHEFGIRDGEIPTGPLVLGTDGNFYGVTAQGGTNLCPTFAICGTVYKITPTGSFKVLYNFDGPHGFAPSGPLALGNDGNLYGITLAGGANGDGVFYQITPSGTLTVLHDFTDAEGHPAAGLVLANDGNFYGASPEAGNSSPSCTSNISTPCGTLFQLTPTGNYSVLHDFDGVHGFFPEVTPFQHTNGLLYGDTIWGGTGILCINDDFKDLCGTFYQLNNNLPAFVSLLPYTGVVGREIGVLGQDFTSTATVSFNGTPATSVIVAPSGTYLTARVPAGATTGFVTVTTSGGTLSSDRQFIVKP